MHAEEKDWKSRLSENILPASFESLSIVHPTYCREKKNDESIGFNF